MFDANDRGLSLTELLELRHLSEDGLRFEEILDPTWLDRQLDITKLEPVGFQCQGANALLEVQPLGPMTTKPPILVRGSASAEMGSTCVRCLEQVVLRFAVAIEQTLFSKEPPTAADETPSLEELDDGSYSLEGIDLANVVREAFLLDIDMNPTCGDETECDARTKALIDAVNRATPADAPDVDPRWAVLKALRDKET